VTLTHAKIVKLLLEKSKIELKDKENELKLREIRVDEKHNRIKSLLGKTN